MNNYAISAKNVSKKFRLYHEKRDSIFEAATSFFQKKQHYEILQAFKRQTGFGVLVNTSFNVRGEPIACSPHDSYTCFMRSQIDLLIMEEFLLKKEAQPNYKEQGDWREEYELD